MQVSNQNSLTWLQTTPAAVDAANQISSSYGQVSPGDDASGADSGETAIAGLQSPAQMFAPASLNALISSQTDTDGISGAPATSAPPHHHHHHHGSASSTEEPQDPTAMSGGGGQAATATAASTNAADTASQADLSGILANL